jgi:putative addiction module component (TIGR02574 family)
MSVTELEQAALQLSPEERIQLAQRLLESTQDDSELEAEWIEIAAQRLEAYRRGEMKAIPREEAWRRVREAAAKRIP